MTSLSGVLARFPKLDAVFVKERLARPDAPARVIIDTDTANEIDDQYALTWALLSPDRLKLEGVTAEPFSFQHHREGLLESVNILRRGGPQTDDEKNSWVVLLAGHSGFWMPAESQRISSSSRPKTA